MDEISTSILHALNGQPYFSDRIKDYFKSNYMDNGLESLSSSELKIIKLIRDNKTTPEIAELLFISQKTVTKHRSNIVQKLGIEKKTNSFLVWALENRELLSGVLG